MAKSHEIKIVNLEKYNPRKDRKKHCWVRVDNTIAFSEDLDGLDPDQKWFWIFLITHASFKQTDTIEQNISFFEKHSGVSIKKINAALTHFANREMIQILPRSVTTGNQSETTGSPTDVTDVTDVTDDTLQPENQVVTAVVEFWNSFEKLPKVIILNSDRKKKLEKRLTEKHFEWVKIIPLIAESDFCLGIAESSTGWKADFDWLIKNDKNYLKVLEGKYKNKSSSPAVKKPGRAQATIDGLKSQAQRVVEGKL